MSMYCYQCEQARGGVACEGAKGVCGKTEEVAALQDELIGALVELARTVTAGGHTPGAAINHLMLESLFATVTNVDFDPASLQARIDAVNEATGALGIAEAYNVQTLWSDADGDDKTLRTLILLGVRGLAAYAYHAMVLGQEGPEVYAFIYKALTAVADPTLDQAELLPLVLETGAVNLAVMELLDTANTSTYGSPAPTAVSLTIEPGPFIVVTGHDLKDLHELLEQTRDTGVNVYTHGEMLPALAYPELKAFPQLKGHFGTAWQNQLKEFDGLPAPVLFTTNCLMPPRESYIDNIFTTSVVAHPGTMHIEADKDGRHDFAPVIARARELGGFAEAKELTGANGGTQMMTGFGHDAVLGVADVVIDAVKGGALTHIFLVGGCDGAKPGRNYFTEFAEATPASTAILTLGCGKFRLNDLELGNIGPLPRILDMGQCNDAYSAIKVAVALADAFECGVNDLPLSLVISWYEQKAVAILLTLLHLGITDIVLGPSLPAFVSPNILEFLVKNFNIAPTTTPEADLARILG
jgi:hydroxylamine reductase